MVKLNLCVLNSIHEVYSSVYTILGEENIIIASPSLDLKVVTPDDLAHRLEKRGIEMKLITPGYIRYRLDARWQHWLRDSLLPEDAKSNRDFTPTWVYYSLGLWHAVYAPAVGEVFNLLIVFSFQVLYGYVYSIIGMLIASFMAGTGSGGAFTTLLKREYDEIFASFFSLKQQSCFLRPPCRFSQQNSFQGWTRSRRVWWKPSSFLSVLQAVFLWGHSFLLPAGSCREEQAKQQNTPEPSMSQIFSGALWAEF